MYKRQKDSLIVIAMVLSSFFLLQQCQLNYKRGNGDIETAEIKVEPFTQINLGGIYEVELIPGKKPLVVIETDENLIPYINVEVFDDMLNINNVHNIKATRGILIRVFYQELTRIHSSGASKISNNEPVKAKNLKIGLSGSGTIRLEIDASFVDVSMSGAGLITLSGKAETLEGRLSGAGMLDAVELETNHCKLNLSGIGGAEVWATDMLEASVSGIGGIKFKGHPKVIERQVTGLGKISPIEDQ